MLKKPANGLPRRVEVAQPRLGQRRPSPAAPAARRAARRRAPSSGRSPCGRRRRPDRWPGRGRRGPGPASRRSGAAAGAPPRAARRPLRAGRSSASRRWMVACCRWRMRVFVTRKLPGGALDRLAAEHDVEVWPEPLPPPREELLARAARARGPAVDAHRPRRRRADRRPRRGCARSRTTRSAWTTSTSRPRPRAGIPVGNTPGVLTDTTADLAVALMLGDRPPAGRGRRLRARAASGAPGSPSCCWGATCTAPPSGSSASAGSARRSRGGWRASTARSCTRAAAAACRSRSCWSAPTSCSVHSPLTPRDARADRRGGAASG